MAHIDLETGEIHCKVAYYGLQASGKYSSLNYLYNHLPTTDKSPLISQEQEYSRIITCSFVRSTQETGYHRPIRFSLVTSSGATFYEHNRIAPLENVDGVIFVVDIQKVKLSENQNSYSEYIRGLQTYQIDSRSLPFVWQFNKQDIPELHRLSTQVLNQHLNSMRHPYVESVASNYTSEWPDGEGVLKAFSLLENQIVQRLLATYGEA